ncbi:MAG: 2OG-Fe(II) oxygenase [Angustibacter sp.]
MATSPKMSRCRRGLSEPEVDYTEGEFILTEQRPRAQTRATAIRLDRGHGVVFPNNRRPVRGGSRVHHVTHRHGASEILTRQRVALALIFHDAA